MTQAAKELYMTQPSVSQAVNELEEEYGVRLFDRLNRKLYVTEAGETLLVYARRMMALNGTIQRVMSRYHQLFFLRIGATLTIGETMFVPLLAKLKETYPSGRIESMIANTAAVEELLLQDKLDVALAEGKIHSEFIKTEPFYQDELILVAAPDHPLAGRTVKKEEIASSLVLIREEGSGTRIIFEETMRLHHAAYTIQGIYNGAEVLKQAARAGLGIAVLSRLSAEKELAREELKEIQIEGIQFLRNFSVAYHKDKEQVREVQAIISWARNERERSGESW